MKSLYAIATLIVATLTLAAFNVDDVVRILGNAKDQFVEQPQEADAVRDLLVRADENDPHALFMIGNLYFNSKWHMSEVQEEVLGQRDPKRGEVMIRRAARLGHPEAMYWVWLLDGAGEGGGDIGFEDILRAESHRAMERVLINAMSDPCDDQTFEYLEVMADVVHDPAFPKNTYGELTEDERSTVRIENLRKFAETFGRVQDIRATGCTVS